MQHHGLTNQVSLIYEVKERYPIVYFEFKAQKSTHMQS